MPDLLALGRGTGRSDCPLVVAGFPMRAAPRAGLAALAALLLLVALAFPTVVAGTPERRADRDGWGSRRIDRARPAQRDRELLDGLPARTRLGSPPPPGRVRSLSGIPSRPLSEPMAVTASSGWRLSPADAGRSARAFLERYG